MNPRLGINIDHIATLRQARGEAYPSVVEAAKVVLENGADQITIHLREDRRHIQDTDVEAVRLVTKKYGKPLNLEMGCNKEIIEIAKVVAPDWVCLVPEKREERTTEGGLNLNDSDIYAKIKESCDALKTNVEKLKISLFVEADDSILKNASKLGKLIDAVEIHTGDFAKDALDGNEIQDYLNQFRCAHELALSNSWGFHAGHGLTDESVLPLLKEKLFEEYNIGHWLICQSVFEGLASVTSRLKKTFN